MRVDADTGTDFTEGLGVHLTGRLAHVHGHGGVAYLGEQPVAGRLTVQMDVEESTVRRAIDIAAREVVTALREYGLSVRLAHIEAMPQHEFDELARALPVELMGVREIAAMFTDRPISRQRADQLTKRTDFPAPVANLASGKIWSGRDVRRWAASWARKEGRPASV
ncbi:hypothetical protein [Acrocarpospora catenulata]|uniref:hypothetical protein n=1 Tax=Acrocarpospora catenulata TaxID=2836182 RepID=UPI001BD9542A|nr:hypothetical protein [Acrocarpospora catenulata]